MSVLEMLLATALIVGFAGVAKQVNQIYQEAKETRRKKFPGT